MKFTRTNYLQQRLQTTFLHNKDDALRGRRPWLPHGYPMDLGLATSNDLSNRKDPLRRRRHTNHVCNFTFAAFFGKTVLAFLSKMMVLYASPSLLQGIGYTMLMLILYFKVMDILLGQQLLQFLSYSVESLPYEVNRSILALTISYIFKTHILRTFYVDVYYVYFD